MEQDQSITNNTHSVQNTEETPATYKQWLQDRQYSDNILYQHFYLERAYKRYCHRNKKEITDPIMILSFIRLKKYSLQSKHFMKVYLSYLQRDDLVKHIPKRQGTKTLVSKKPLQYLTYQEVQELIRYAERKDRTEYAIIIALLYFYGLRIDEFCKLTKVDFYSNTIDKTITSMTVTGKRNKIRTLPVDPSHSDAFEGWIVCLEDKQPLAHYLLKGAYKRDARSLASRIRFNIKKLGKGCFPYKKSIYPHLFRHSSATRLAQKGFSLLELKEFLGHANVTTTEIYVNNSHSARVREGISLLTNDIISNSPEDNTKREEQQK